MADQSFRPCVEILEDRCVPATTVTQVGRIVTVRGDFGSNNIFINDNGQRDKAISVQHESGTFQSTGQVIGIHVFAGPGRDRVFYNLTGDLQQGLPRNISIDMGSGPLQTCAVTLQGSLGPRSYMNVNIRGSSDRERLSFSSGGTIGAGAVLRVFLFGGGGGDTLTSNLSGVIDGQVVMRSYGGGFYDAVRSNITASSGSDGAISVKLYGGPGPDLLSLIAVKSNLNDLLGFEFVIDGGPGGPDRAVHTGNVAVFDIEVDEVISG
jgi:hypothetical protein